MKSIIKSIVFLFLVVFMSGCKDIVTIEGNSELYTGNIYSYKSVITTDKVDSLDSYRWSVTPKEHVELTNADKAKVEIKVLKEGSYTIHLIAKKKKKAFTALLKINVVEQTIIDGFLLPPEPDETLNNSTLLGIDSNDNGVRDDVERWILLDMEIRYGNSKAERAIALENAKAYQMTLKDPTNKDDKVGEAMSDAGDCEAYYIYVKNEDQKSYAGEQHRNMSDRMFNTKERLKTYWAYDGTLGGRVFTKTPNRLYHTKCSTETYNIIEGK